MNDYRDMDQAKKDQLLDIINNLKKDRDLFAQELNYLHNRRTMWEKDLKQLIKLQKKNKKLKAKVRLYETLYCCKRLPN